MIIEPKTTFNYIALLDAMINHSFNPVFWYIYQLLLLTLISPIIYYISIIKKMSLSLLTIFSLLIIFNIDIPFINEDAMIYYSFGCYLSRLYKNNKINLIDNQFVFVFSLASILVFILNRYLHKNIFINIELLPYYTLSIIYLRITISMTILYLCDIFFNYKRTPKYMNYTFFLYAIHYMIVRFIIIIILSQIIYIGISYFL